VTNPGLGKELSVPQTRQLLHATRDGEHVVGSRMSLRLLSRLQQYAGLATYNLPVLYIIDSKNKRAEVQPTRSSKVLMAF
jgi:hypothetical protein